MTENRGPNEKEDWLLLIIIFGCVAVIVMFLAWVNMVELASGQEVHTWTTEPVIYEPGYAG